MRYGRGGQMINMIKISVLSVMLVIAVLSLSACSSGVSQPEYDRVKTQLSEMKNQLESTQAKLAEYENVQAKYEITNAKYEDLGKQYENIKKEYLASQVKYDDLNKQYATIKSQYETMQTQYEMIQKQYEDLTEQFNAATGIPPAFSVEDVEQALFGLINQERRANSLDELSWGDNLYWRASANSQDMATNKKLGYSSYQSWQEVFWATGYGTADEVANAALNIWRNGYNYGQTVLNSVPPYGAVGVYKWGEIFYITYIASHFQ